MVPLSAAELLSSADFFLCRSSADFYSLKPGDWFLTVMASPSPGDLVMTVVDGERVIARLQGKTIKLPNRKVRRRWDLIGVVKPIPDWFLGCRCFEVARQIPQEFVSQVN